MLWILAAIGLTLHSAMAGAAPFVPRSDAQVLERLPTRPSDPVAIELRRLRANLAADPSDADAAVALAERYFELAAGEGDPRYVGYAEAALRPWRSGDAPPPEVLYMRGLLRQYRHDFDGALEDLGLTLRSEPDHVGAHAWRAAIFMVRADYPSAARECAALRGATSELNEVGCAAYVEAATGKTREAYQRLSAALGRSDAGPNARLWALTRLAEMAWRLQDYDAADRLFRRALALGIDDNFLLAAYADFLLERGREREVVPMLKGWTRSDTLLLRLALAEHALGLAEGPAHIQALVERFAAATLRGERLHMGEEARYLLDLKGDARRALAVGLENWKEQREPRDAQVVLEAALAAHDAAAAAPVLQWLRTSGFESERLARLAAALR